MPSPKGKWTFEDVSELLKPAEGTLQLQAATLGNKSATLCETVAEAGITATGGPIAENKAILVPKDAALWVAFLFVKTPLPWRAFCGILYVL